MAALRKSRREKFCQLIAHNSCDTQGQAYLQAGYRGNPRSLKVNAHNLMKVEAVQLRIAEIREEHSALEWQARQLAVASTALTRELVISQLLDTLERAKSNGRFDGAVANRACELLGKELGMFIERREAMNVNYVLRDRPPTEEEWIAAHADRVN